MDKRVRERIRMNMSPKEYNRYVARLAKKSPLGKDLLNSFLIGGLICVIGQLILNGYTALELSEQDAAAATKVTLLFLSPVLTGLSVYDDLAKIAGAGTLVPRKQAAVFSEAQDEQSTRC